MAFLLGPQQSSDLMSQAQHRLLWAPSVLGCSPGQGAGLLALGVFGLQWFLFRCPVTPACCCFVIYFFLQSGSTPGFKKLKSMALYPEF